MTDKQFYHAFRAAQQYSDPDAFASNVALSDIFPTVEGDDLPALAKFICSQYGGPDGELGASLRYLSQRYAMPYPELSALLTDIGTEAAEMALQIEA